MFGMSQFTEISRRAGRVRPLCGKKIRNKAPAGPVFPGIRKGALMKRKAAAILLSGLMAVSPTACVFAESLAEETAMTESMTEDTAETAAETAAESIPEDTAMTADESAAEDTTETAAESAASRASTRTAWTAATTPEEKEAIEYALNLANNEDVTWTYDSASDAWVMSVVTAVLYPEIEEEQGVSVCMPGAYVRGIDTDGDGAEDVTAGEADGAVHGLPVIDEEAEITSTSGQVYTALTAPCIVTTGAAGYSEQTSRTASAEYAAEGYISVSCGNRGKQSQAEDEEGNVYYTGDAPSCLVDQKNAIRFVKYNMLLGNLPGSVDYFVTTGGSGGGAHAVMAAATSDNPDFYDYEIESGAVGVYRNEDGTYSTSVTIDGEETELSDGVWGTVAYSAITSLAEGDMAMAFEYYLDTDYDFNTPFQAQLAEYLSAEYMEYINAQELSVKESQVGFDLNGDGDTEDEIVLTIEYDEERYADTNGYGGTYLDFYLAEFTQNLQWYLDHLDYAEGWTWFDADGNALSDEEAAAMTSEDRAEAFLNGWYAKGSSGGHGGMGMMGGPGGSGGNGPDGMKGGFGGRDGNGPDGMKDGFGGNGGNGPDGMKGGFGGNGGSGHDGMKDGFDGGSGPENLPEDGMPEGEMPAGEMPEGGLSEGEMPAGEMPEGGLSEGEMPAGEMPEDGMPGGETPDGAETEKAGTPDAGTTQAAGSRKDSSDYASFEELLQAYEEDVAEAEAGDRYGNSQVDLYNPLNYIGEEDTEDPVWSVIVMGAAEGDMSMFASLNLQIAWLAAGTDASIEWQWDGGHVPSEIFGESLALRVDEMYAKYVDGAAEVTKAEADPQTENGSATEPSGTDLTSWVDVSDTGRVSFSLADAAAYRTAGAAKAIPGFDVIDYGQECYVFGSAEKDARHWNPYLLEALEENAETLGELFNQ